MSQINRALGVTPQANYGISSGIERHVKAKQSNFHRVFSDSPEQPLDYNDYALGLSLLISEHQAQKKVNARQTVSEIPAFDQELSANLASQLENIIGDIKKSSKVPIDYDQDFAHRVDAWRDRFLLEQFPRSNQRDESLCHSIAAQLDFMFISLVEEINAKHFMTDVEKFFSENKKASQERDKLTRALATKYGLTKRQSKHFIDLLNPNRYSLENIMKVLKYLNKEYAVDEKKADFAKHVLTHSLTAVAKSYGCYISNSPAGVFLGAVLNGIGMRVTDSTKEKHTDFTKPLQRQLNQRIADALLLKDYENIDESRFAQIHTVLARGRNSSINLIATLTAQLAPQAISIASSVLFMGAVHPALFASSMVSLPIIFKQATNFLPEFQDLQEQNQKAREKATKEIQAIVETADEVLTSAHPEVIAGTLETKQNEEDELAIKLQELNYKMTKTLNSVFFLAQSATAGLGLGLYEFDQISKEEAISGGMVGASVVGPFINLVMSSQNFLKELQFVQEMEELLQEGKTIDINADSQKPGMSSLESHDIRIDNLQYLASNSDPILENLSLEIPQGSTLLVTGRSGVGKSTLIRCFLGLYTPSNGSISIGGLDRNSIRQFGDDSVRESISACGQSPKVLEGKTLRENLLLYTSRKVDDSEIVELLNKLDLQNFVDNLDEKIKKPSGGQKARIGIARALLRGNSKTKILVLDEPTAGLDEKTTTDFLELLKTLKETHPNLTVICITHKPSCYIKSFEQSNLDINEYNFA